MGAGLLVKGMGATLVKALQTDRAPGQSLLAKGGYSWRLEKTGSQPGGGLHRWRDFSRRMRRHPPGKKNPCSDLESLHQFFQLDGQFGQSLGALLHLAAALAHLGRLLVDAGDIAGYVGDHHR
jgi:hypothetical protein